MWGKRGQREELLELDDNSNFIPFYFLFQKDKLPFYVVLLWEGKEKRKCKNLKQKLLYTFLVQQQNFKVVYNSFSFHPTNFGHPLEWNDFSPLTFHRIFNPPPNSPPPQTNHSLSPSRLPVFIVPISEVYMFIPTTQKTNWQISISSNIKIIMQNLL